LQQPSTVPSVVIPSASPPPADDAAAGSGPKSSAAGESGRTQVLRLGTMEQLPCRFENCARTDIVSTGACGTTGIAGSIRVAELRLEMRVKNLQ
jgi:hypothetical protein